MARHGDSLHGQEEGELHEAGLIVMNPKHRRLIGDPRPVEGGRPQSSEREDEVLPDLIEECLVESETQAHLGP